MTATSKPGDPPADGVLSVHETAVAVGLSISTDKFRALMRADPHLRGLFFKIGRNYALPVNRLPAVRERLGPRA